MSRGAVRAMADPDRPITAVADAGPPIHLDELGVLELLADFREVWVPDAVWRELQRHRPNVLKNVAIHWVRHRALPNSNVDALARLYTLHAGEREALSLCMDKPDLLLLTDDSAARLAAQALAVPAHGTLGILIRAIRRNQLPYSAVLDLLSGIPNRSSLHIRPDLLAEIIGQIAATPKAKL